MIPRQKLVCIVELDADSPSNARAKLEALCEGLNGKDRFGDRLTIYEVPDVVKVLEIVSRGLKTKIDVAVLLCLQDAVHDILGVILDPTAHRVVPYPDKWRL